MSFDGLVMKQTINDLNRQLSFGKVNKIYQVSKYELLFLIRANKENVKLLISCHPNYARLHLTKLSYPTPEVPSQLVMSFRKHLEGSFIKSITQLDYERIAIIEFLGRNEMGDDTIYKMYIEIMGKHSNITLCKQEDIIIDAIKRINPTMSTIRVILPGATYNLPPLQENKKSPQLIGDIYDKMYLDYHGLSPLICKEMVYLNQGKPCIDTILSSNTLYITHNELKEDYHLIPLTHMQGSSQAFPLHEGLDYFYQKKDEHDRIKQQTSDLTHLLKNELDKNTLKLAKLNQELFDSQNSEDLKLKGELLYSYLHLIKKGMSSITVDNYYTNQPLTIELDVRYDGKTNAKRYFQKYNKAKNAIAYLNEQIEKTTSEIEYFTTLLDQMQFASYYDAIEIKEELETTGYLKKKKKTNIRKKKNIPHFETFTMHDGTKIVIGKNNIQNDYLTFKLAKRSDMWFHVKDMPGSHVIVLSDQLSEAHIRTAANLAALYSKAHHSSSVAVNYTTIGSLKKAPGNFLGKVILNHYKTIYIDPDQSLLEGEFNDGYH